MTSLDDKVVNFYLNTLSMFLFVIEPESTPEVVERILKFHKSFFKGALQLFRLVFAYVITFWIYNVEGFEVAVLVVLIGILLTVGSVAVNTKLPD